MIESIVIKENNFRKGIFIIILIEFLLFILSGVSFQGLYQSVYFDAGIDPVYWTFFLLQIPQFIFIHYEVGLILDISILLLLIYSVFIKENKIITWTLFILLTMYYVSLTAILGHRNYQTGFFIMIIPFLFSNQTNRKFAFEGIKYFYLFFYFSSGIFKFINQGINEPMLLSLTLKEQFIPYYLETNFSWRTSINSFLTQHNSITYFMYCVTIFIECFFVIGFFTNKLNYTLGILLVIFHLSNWIIMDIAPIGQLPVIYLLLNYKKVSD